MEGRGWNHWGIEGNYDSCWHPNAVLNGLGSDDFNCFIENVLCKCPGLVSELYFSFAKPSINFVGKTENLKEDLAKVLLMAGVPFESNSLNTPRQNVSPVKPALAKWAPSLKRQFIMTELPAMLRFGYLTVDDCEAYDIPSDLLSTKLIPPIKLDRQLGGRD